MNLIYAVCAGRKTVESLILARMHCLVRQPNGVLIPREKVALWDNKSSPVLSNASGRQLAGLCL